MILVLGGLIEFAITVMDIKTMLLMMIDCLIMEGMMTMVVVLGTGAMEEAMVETDNPR